MHFDELAGQGQPQAGALLLPPIRGIHLLELKKDSFLVLWLDADSSVLHHHP